MGVTSGSVKRRQIGGPHPTNLQQRQKTLAKASSTRDPKWTFGILDGAVRKSSPRRAVMPASFRRYAFYFPKGQLTSGPISPPTDCSSGYVVSRIVIFGPRSSRDVRAAAPQTSHYKFLPSLTKRLELLRQNKVRARPLRASEEYLAEVYRLQPETFRDPKVHEQVRRLAAICEREARKAEEFEIKGSRWGARQSDRLVGGVQGAAKVRGHSRASGPSKAQFNSPRGVSSVSTKDEAEKTQAQMLRDIY